jgi:hypothetical protein
VVQRRHLAMRKPSSKASCMLRVEPVEDERTVQQDDKVLWRSCQTVYSWSLRFTDGISRGDATFQI